MSQVTIGPPLVINGPLPTPPPYALMSAAQIVDEPNSHWMSGGAVYGYPSVTPEAHDPCSTGTFRDKDTVDESPVGYFGAFTAYLPITCSAMGIIPGEFENRARIAFQATQSYIYERELSQGEVMVLNPFLADANADPVAAGAVLTPSVGLRYLEDAIGATGRAGLIHATPAVASAWSAELMSDGTRLRTIANGTPVAAGGGYAGAQPEGEAAPAAGQAWAFATGPVQIRLSPIEIVPGTLAEALDRENNVVTYRAERNVLVTWDTALQAAALIDWTP